MIPYGRQSINRKDIKSVAKSLKAQLITTGPVVNEFELELSKVVGAPTVTVSSGTAALHSAYSAIGIKPGDEIITPPITFIATQATAALMGAKVVFAEVQSETFNIDPKFVAKAITSKTKAIVAVDFAGHPADLYELKALAMKNNIYLIEDAAHSIGSFYRELPVGSIADITTFSFFPTKNFTTAEGGAVSSNNSLLLERARRFSRQGLVREPNNFKSSNEGAWHQEVHEFGLNYRLSDVLSALGLSQLKRINSFSEKKRNIYNFYMKELGGISTIQLPVERNYVKCNRHLFPILVEAKNRRFIFDELRGKGIGVQVNYIPAYRHPVFSESKINPLDFPISEDFYSREISLPIYPDLSLRKAKFIVNTLKALIKAA
jgi:dTDP-4-amino-4,6-dideoxygalactose transaminase